MAGLTTHTTEERRVLVDGMAFRFRDAGPAEPAADPYLLVHGIGMSHRYLARLQAVLAAAGSRAVTVDLPGFGGLPKPGRDLDVAAMADALERACDAAGIGPSILVGQSMGTQWAAELAARHPERASAVVLIGPVADERHRTLPRQALALTVDTLREPPGANLLVFTDYLRCGVPWYLTQLRHMLAHPLEERVRGIRSPLLVLRGGRDPIAGHDWARRVAAAAPDGRLVVVPGHAHNVQHSAPRAVAPALAAFAAGTAPGGAS